ncbi:MAG: hypothetical protein AAGA84_11005 [Pseudomonadota bacterium]
MTFKTLAAISLAASIMLAPAAVASCDYPSRVDIPSGNTASKDDMIATQKAVKGYMADMNEYLDCIEAEAKAAETEGEDPDVTAQRAALLLKRHNAAVAEMQSLADAFNVEVRAYKARTES